MGFQGGTYLPGLIPGPAWTGEDPIWPDSVPVDNGSNVEDNPTPPPVSGVTPGSYAQPDTGAPAANADVSVAGVAPPPSAIVPDEGENYVQPDTSAPAANPQIGVPTISRNPMGL
jgi:hypothetical protein